MVSPRILQNIINERKGLKNYQAAGATIPDNTIWERGEREIKEKFVILENSKKEEYKIEYFKFEVFIEDILLKNKSNYILYIIEVASFHKLKKGRRKKDGGILFL